jgi:hypothetical protein
MRDHNTASATRRPNAGGRGDGQRGDGRGEAFYGVLGRTWPPQKWTQNGHLLPPSCVTGAARCAVARQQPPCWRRTLRLAKGFQA